MSDTIKILIKNPPFPVKRFSLFILLQMRKKVNTKSPLRTEKSERVKADRLLIFLKELCQRAVMIDFFLCGFYNKYKKNNVLY